MSSDSGNEDAVSKSNSHEEIKKADGNLTVNQRLLPQDPGLISSDSEVSDDNPQSGDHLDAGYGGFAAQVEANHQEGDSSIKKGINNIIKGVKALRGKQTPQLSTKNDAPDYCMTHKRRGRCLIINNKTFDKKTKQRKRTGTEKDVEALKTCFRNFKFEVDVINDKPVHKIMSRVRKLSSQDFSKDDCVVICVLTHGDKGGILWGRDKTYSIENLYSLFTGDNCNSLVGKPKIFLVQACQGDGLDDGLMTKKFGGQVDSGQNQGSDESGGDELDAVPAPETLLTSSHFIKIPVCADFLIMYSTFPGYASIRNKDDGSWFVQSLVSVLNKLHNYLDLVSILTHVNRKVAYDYESVNKRYRHLSGKKQIPLIASTLTRKVYLSPKVADNGTNTTCTRRPRSKKFATL